MSEDRGLFEALVDDGRPALTLTALGLFAAGGFAIFLAVRREFLPHDIEYLGMSARDLCAFDDCRVVRFMFHDRVAFGGTLMAIATLYLWLAAFPLRAGAAWAWDAFAVSGVLGFGSFLAYLGFGYLDAWHGTATALLLPTFVFGVMRTRLLARERTIGWLRTPEGRRAPAGARVGRWGILATGAGLLAAGLVISYIGITEVFVREDLGFMGVTRGMLDAMSPRLVPLIAHDRSGFGGGLATTGVLLLMCGWFARPTRSFHQAVLVAGTVGFGCGIGTHFFEGYTNPLHLAPAIAGAVLFWASAIAEMTAMRDSPEPAPASAR